MLQNLFLNATILISMLSIGNQFVLKNHDLNPTAPLKFRIFSGFLTGCLGILLMIYGVPIQANMIMDFRFVAIVLSGVYGGPISALISGLMIGVFRLFEMGVSPTSWLAAVTVVLVSIGCGLIAKLSISLFRKWLWSILLALVAGSVGYAILITDFAILLRVLIASWGGTLLMSYIVYLYADYTFTSSRLFRKYKQEATKDFLTGLNSVREFDKSFNAAITGAEHNRQSLSLLFIDIDHFKLVNDQYGHPNGDEILKQLGRILREACRGVDEVSRNGGEEFSVLLYECPHSYAIEVAERIRKTVEGNQFLLLDYTCINITVSIGVASYPETVANIDRLLEQADASLYAAKHSGRNKVVAAEKITA